MNAITNDLVAFEPLLLCGRELFNVARGTRSFGTSLFRLGPGGGGIISTNNGKSQQQMADVAMQAIRSLSVAQHSEVLVRGWVCSVQAHKKQTFVFVRDGASPCDRIQVVIPVAPDGEEEEKNGCSKLELESYVQVAGQLVERKQKTGHLFEILALEVQVLSRAAGDFAQRCPPNASLQHDLEYRHLTVRSQRAGAIVKLRALLVAAIRRTLERMGCVETFPPCFVSNQCEGGATLFALQHPPNKRGSDPIDAYLTQSSQFYLEMALPAVGDCYCIYPSFRAEKSHTRRHLTEFLHAECEWRDVHSLEDHLDKLRALVAGILADFLALDVDDLLTFFGRREAIEAFQKMEVRVVTHQQAIALCREFEIYGEEETKTHFGPRDDIPEKQERALIDRLNCIVLLCGFPREFKSFYMAADPADPSRVLGCDVEVPGVGEIIGSGVRVSSVEDLVARLKEQGLKEEEYTEYIDLRKYGFGFTSGMGLGVDRMLTWLLGLDNIKEAVTFPRFPGYLRP